MKRACGLTGAGLSASLICVSCSIRSTGPHWIETHGHAQVQRVSGGPLGLLAIGTNGLVYSYPEFGSVWHEWNGRLHPSVIVGSRQGLLYADQEGRVGRGNRGHVSPPEWNLGSPVTALASDEDGSALFAVASGHISKLLPSGLAPGPCGELQVVAITIAQGELWVSDGQHLYLGSDAACRAAPGAPPKIVRVAGLGKRVFALDESGSLFRRESGGAWQALPRPKKFRPDRMPQLRPATDVAVTATAAWLVDDEQNVFVLSESE